MSDAIDLIIPQNPNLGRELVQKWFQNTSINFLLHSWSSSWLKKFSNETWCNWWDFQLIKPVWVEKSFYNVFKMLRHSYLQKSSSLVTLDQNVSRIVIDAIDWLLTVLSNFKSLNWLEAVSKSFGLGFASILNRNVVLIKSNSKPKLMQFKDFHPINQFLVEKHIQNGFTSIFLFYHLSSIKSWSRAYAELRTRTIESFASVTDENNINTKNEFQREGTMITASFSLKRPITCWKNEYSLSFGSGEYADQSVHSW